MDEVGTRREVGVVGGVADFVDAADGADEGGGEAEEVAVCGLRGGAWVGNVVGAGADAELAADFVLDDAADRAGEVDFHCGTVDAHGCIVCW